MLVFIDIQESFFVLTKNVLYRYNITCKGATCNKFKFGTPQLARKNRKDVQCK